MKAIVQYKYGSADVLELRDIDKPEIGGDEVLVVARGRRRPGSLASDDWPAALLTPHHPRPRAPSAQEPRSS
jgi:hypothetical protein